jgi:hypothetical protein
MTIDILSCADADSDIDSITVATSDTDSTTRPAALLAVGVANGDRDSVGQIEKVFDCVNSTDALNASVSANRPVAINGRVATKVPLALPGACGANEGRESGVTPPCAVTTVRPSGVAAGTRVANGGGSLWLTCATSTPEPTCATGDV